VFIPKKLAFFFIGRRVVRQNFLCKICGVFGRYVCGDGVMVTSSLTAISSVSIPSSDASAMADANGIALNSSAMVSIMLNNFVAFIKIYPLCIFFVSVYFIVAIFGKFSGDVET
jgi:hypothetical protein